MVDGMRLGRALDQRAGGVWRVDAFGEGADDLAIGLELTLPVVAGMASTPRSTRMGSCIDQLTFDQARRGGVVADA